MIRYFFKAMGAHFRSGRLLFVLTVLGVALGVASVLSIQIINQGALGAFEGVTLLEMYRGRTLPPGMAPYVAIAVTGAPANVIAAVRRMDTQGLEDEAGGVRHTTGWMRWVPHRGQIARAMETLRDQNVAAFHKGREALYPSYEYVWEQALALTQGRPTEHNAAAGSGGGPAPGAGGSGRGGGGGGRGKGQGRGKGGAVPPPPPPPPQPTAQMSEEERETVADRQVARVTGGRMQSLAAALQLVSETADTLAKLQTSVARVEQAETARTAREEAERAERARRQEEKQAARQREAAAQRAATMADMETLLARWMQRGRHERDQPAAAVQEQEAALQRRRAPLAQLQAQLLAEGAAVQGGGRGGAAPPNF